MHRPIIRVVAMALLNCLPVASDSAPSDNSAFQGDYPYNDRSGTEVFMRLRSLSLNLLALACCASSLGQQPVANQPATSVQLPSFSQFSINTTVSVPDRGSISLGGNDRGVDQSITRGPIRNRASSSSRTASSVSMSATIIDHAELDRAVLAAAAAKRGEVADASSVKAAALSSAVARGGEIIATGRASGGSLPGSVAAIRKEHEAASDLESAELASYLAKGQQAEAEGKATVARIFYQMVARRDQGQLKQQALARLAALTPSATAPAKR